MEILGCPVVKNPSRPNQKNAEQYVWYQVGSTGLVDTAHRRHFWGSTPELKGLLHMAVGAVDALLCRVAVVYLKQLYLG